MFRICGVDYLDREMQPPDSPSTVCVRCHGDGAVQCDECEGAGVFPSGNRCTCDDGVRQCPECDGYGHEIET